MKLSEKWPAIERAARTLARVGQVLMFVSRSIGAIPPLCILCRPEVATFQTGKQMTG